MNYHLVFDIAGAGHQDPMLPVHAITLIVAGALLVIFSAWKLISKQAWKKREKIFLIGNFLFAALFAAAITDTQRREHASIVSAIQSGRAQVVEGEVSDFVPMPATGHAMERFCVKTQCFEYSDHVITEGFNNTSSHGGPIRAGLPVRVTYVGDTIIKLEVVEQP